MHYSEEVASGSFFSFLGLVPLDTVPGKDLHEIT